MFLDLSYEARTFQSESSVWLQQVLYTGSYTCMTRIDMLEQR